MEKLLIALVIVQALALVVNMIAVAGQLALWSKVVNTPCPPMADPEAMWQAVKGKENDSQKKSN